MHIAMYVELIICIATVAIQLKMGSISNSFLDILSAVTNKGSQGCLNFCSKGALLLPN